MVRRIACLVTIGLVLSGITAVASNSKKEAAALVAAKKWLALVDDKKYAESWNEANEYFKHTVQPKLWVESMKALREPLGKLISRTVETKIYKTALPGSPEGEYVVIQFKTSFENLKSAVETVTPMMGKDGVWRVAGYYVK
jgi:hypothetical protein